MVLREYDEAAHIKNEKKISFEEGVISEREKLLKIVILKAINAGNAQDAILAELINDYGISPENAAKYYKKVIDNTIAE